MQSVSTNNAIELRGVSKRYGSHSVVRSLDLSVQAGESLAVIGHNGAGKTTLMKMILGLTRPSAGNIRLWDGQGAVGGNTAIGFLPEAVSFHGAMTGCQVLGFYARLKRIPAAQCEGLLELVGLSDVARRRVGDYSKGMRQRLGLAQALLGEPRLLLLDEPTSGMDPFLRGHFYDIIGARQAAGATILISSHALTEIEARTDRVVILKDGRSLIQGTLKELRTVAKLPTRILVDTAPGSVETALGALPPDVEHDIVSSHRIEFRCSKADKLTLLQRITQLDDIEDVQVVPPRLEDLYAHFVNGDLDP